MAKERLIGPDHPDLQQDFDNNHEEPNGPEQFYKCPGCKCTFLTQADLHKHRQTYPDLNHQEELTADHKHLEYDNETDDSNSWYPSKYGGNEWLKPKNKDRKLAQQLSLNGPTTMGKWEYRLNGNWIIKKPI